MHRDPCHPPLVALEPFEPCPQCGRAAGEHRAHPSQRIPALEEQNRDLATVNGLLDDHGAKLRQDLAERDVHIAALRKLLAFERERRLCRAGNFSAGVDFAIGVSSNHRERAQAMHRRAQSAEGDAERALLAINERTAKPFTFLVAGVRELIRMIDSRDARHQRGEIAAGVQMLRAEMDELRQQNSALRRCFRRLVDAFHPGVVSATIHETDDEAAVREILDAGRATVDYRRGWHEALAHAAAGAALQALHESGDPLTPLTVAWSFARVAVKLQRAAKRGILHREEARTDG